MGFTRYNPACAGTTACHITCPPSPAIQPRVCGDYALCCLIQPPSSDTTPRVRGLRARTISGRDCLRYNPACAGTTREKRDRETRQPIQPRVCRDYLAPGPAQQRHVDTTPRVRGLSASTYRSTFGYRYNPACAGTTADGLCLGSRRSIQPRVCGDYKYANLRTYSLYDTTPRVRGLQQMVFAWARDARYNPACAGTTNTPISARTLYTIQPRVCGDYVAPNCSSGVAIDTTPRVRGLPIGHAVRTCSRRYNPACAGTTSQAYQTAHHHTIQPRVCGDYINLFLPRAVCFDTTPRVRGLRSSPCPTAQQVRYNPACAGTTFSVPKVSLFPAIQPRVCGDYAVIASRRPSQVDTTPRVRGLPRAARSLSASS